MASPTGTSAVKPTALTTPLSAAYKLIEIHCNSQPGQLEEGHDARKPITEGGVPMAGAKDRIPAETRWEIATKGLTGACLAYMNTLKEILSEEKFNDFQGALWSQAGKQVKELSDSVGLAVRTPRDVHEAMDLLATTGMGPEFALEVVDATEDKCVGKTTKCAWHERWKELGLKSDICQSGHQAWGEGVVESLGGGYSFSLTKNMVRGDPYCEWTIQRKP